MLAAGHRSAAPRTNSFFGNIGSSGIVKGRRSRQVGEDYGYGGAFSEDGYIRFLAVKKDTDYNNYVKKKKKTKKAKTMTMLSGRCVYSIFGFESKDHDYNNYVKKEEGRRRRRRRRRRR